MIFNVSTPTNGRRKEAANFCCFSFLERFCPTGADGGSPTSGRRREADASCSLLSFYVAEQLVFGALHRQRGFRVGLLLGETLQLCQSDARLQKALALR